MDKKEIVKHLLDKAQKELAEVKSSYAATLELVQNGDLKSDGKYDTRATEANYLADGQRQRITDLESELTLLEEIPTHALGTDSEVAIGALVELEINSQARSYFISPTAGGTMLNMDGQTIMVISVFSPIGSEAIALSAGDNFEVEINGSTREYLIKKVF